MNENRMPKESEEPLIADTEAVASEPTDEISLATDVIQNDEPSAIPDTDPGDAPAENKILGMPAFIFRGTAVGIALGLILTGIFRLEGTYLPVIVCGALGWFISKTLYGRKDTP